MTLLSTLGINTDDIHRLVEIVQGADAFGLGQTIRVDSVLTLSTVCQALSAADPRDSLELTTRDRSEVPQAEYLPAGSERIDPVLLERAVTEGATLMVTNLTMWGKELNADPDPHGASRLEVNMFVSGPLCQAYPAHFDLLDAVIIQLVGKKGWQLWQTLPADSPQRDSRQMQFGRPAVSTTLASGDVLIMPSFTPHLVASTFVPSVHIAIAVREDAPQ